MIALDEDALICDFAETYGIYSIYEMPVTYIATLAVGLRYDSRIMMAINGLEADIDLKTLLLAHIADYSAKNVYMKTKDAEKGINPPKSFVKILMGNDEEKVKGFESGDDFMKEWERINNE